MSVVESEPAVPVDTATALAEAEEAARRRREQEAAGGGSAGAPPGAEPKPGAGEPQPEGPGAAIAALAAERFDYVGLIGSASKRARFTRLLRDADVPESRIAELVCPVGMPSIRSKHPAAIATGIAAQLLERAGP